MMTSNMFCAVEHHLKQSTCIMGEIYDVLCLRRCSIAQNILLVMIDISDTSLFQMNFWYLLGTLPNYLW